MAQPKRKLAAILSADAAGYSRLMADDETATVEALIKCREVLRTHIARHHGRVVDAPGDNLLAEFASPVEAVECAVEAQRELARFNRQFIEARRMHFRIGINLGDVLEKEGGLFGDGVNVAARLEGLAEPGGICISETVYQHLEGKLDLDFKDIGEQQVKNIPRPVRVYRVSLEPSASPSARTPARPGLRPVLIAAAAAVVLAVAGVVVWQATQPPAPKPTAAEDDPVLAMPTGPTIAVLPFTNMSGDPEQEFFSDGLTEDIITALSRFKELFVIARNTTFQYKNRAVDVKTIGRELSARYVVEGSVRRAGDTVRVTAQLVDATDGSHLWAETFDRQLKASELFALQDEITSAIVGAIAGSYGVISRDRLGEAEAQGTDSLEAYECVLRAYAYEHILTPEFHAKTRDCLERAVELDPSYADAWSKLAFMYADEHAFGFNPRPGSLERALEVAQRAVELDPSSQMTHWHLARTLFWRNEVEKAVTEAERALALNPNNAFVLAAAGLYMAFTNPENRKRGVALADKAMLIDPNAPGWYHVPNILNQYEKRDYKAALVASLKMNIPGFFYTHVWRVAIYGQLGRASDAAESVARLLDLYPTFPENARHELQKINTDPALIEHIVEGWRKGGLEVPDEPATTD